MLDHGLTAAAAPLGMITPEARALLLRATRGIPRLISHLLRISLCVLLEAEAAFEQRMAVEPDGQVLAAVEVEAG